MSTTNTTAATPSPPGLHHPSIHNPATEATEKSPSEAEALETTKLEVVTEGFKHICYHVDHKTPLTHDEHMKHHREHEAHIKELRAKLASADQHLEDHKSALHLAASENDELEIARAEQALAHSNLVKTHELHKKKVGG